MSIVVKNEPDRRPLGFCHALEEMLVKLGQEGLFRVARTIHFLPGKSLGAQRAVFLADNCISAVHMVWKLGRIPPHGHDINACDMDTGPIQAERHRLRGKDVLGVLDAVKPLFFGQGNDLLPSNQCGGGIPAFKNNCTTA